MNYAVLHDELTLDPLARGYAGMTDAEAATDLNTEYRQVHVESMSGSEVAQNIVPAEYAALTDTKKTQTLALFGWSSLNPWGKEADVMIGIFGVGSQTIANLQTTRLKMISRAVELGLGFVFPGDVQAARLYPVP